MSDEQPAADVLRFLLPRSTIGRTLAVLYLLAACFGYWMLLTEGGESGLLLVLVTLPLWQFMYHGFDIPMESWLYALVPPMQIVIACVIVHGVGGGVRRLIAHASQSQSP